MTAKTIATASARLVIRTADRHFECPGSRPILGHHTHVDVSGQIASAVLQIKPALNPDFSPECLGKILPGDRYIADADSDRRYCLRCGTSRAANAESPQ